jgi:hypothetical protein
MTIRTPAGAAVPSTPAPAVPTWFRTFPLPISGPQWLRAMWLRVLRNYDYVPPKETS